MPIDWKALNVDNNTGRLLDTNLPETDDLYLTLSIVKPSAAEQAEFYKHNDYKTFRAAVDDQLTARDKPLEQVTAAVTKVVATQASRGKQSALSDTWSTAEVALNAYRVETAHNASPAGCTMASQPDARTRDLARRKAQGDVRSFVLAIAQALEEPDVTITTGGSITKQPAFAPRDQTAVLDQVASYFLPWDSDFAEADFKTIDAFKAAFLESGKTEILVDLAIKRAETLPSSKTHCDVLKAAGLAT